MTNQSLLRSYRCMLAMWLVLSSILLTTAGSAFAQPPTTPAAHTNSPTAAPDTIPATLRAMLLDYRRYAETLWHFPATKTGTASATPSSAFGWWGSGKSDGGNEGMRAQANTALVYALLIRNGDMQFSAADRVEPALRYAAAIHVTGPSDAKGTDGKKWGDSWQSAMWAANLGVAAFLVRDKLTPETLAAVERVVAHEADRFVGAAPPTMEPGDTKAEENAWDLTAPAAALLLLPNDPRAKGWDEAVKRFGFNTLSVKQDKTDGKIEDGKPVRDWVTTEQLYPDFTLENHGIFHPVYAMIAPATMAQAAVAYRLGGRPVPDALRHNVLPEWQMLQAITLPDGEWLYTQGLDWDLHDYEHLHYWTELATLFQDPYAALLEKRTVDYARRRQQINGDGRFVGASSGLGFAREAVQAERVAFALLMHEQFGAPPAPATNAAFASKFEMGQARDFEPAGFVVYQTTDGAFSFSWKNRLMGLISPIPYEWLEDRPGLPYLTTPNTESLVGHFRLQGQSDRDGGKWKVNAHRVSIRKDGFTAAVDAEVNNGRLRQQIAVVAVSSGVLFYLDRVTALTNVTVTEERGVALSIENDDVSGGQRSIWTGHHNTAPLEIAAGKAGDHPLDGAWASIDDNFGLAMATAEGKNPSNAPALLYRSIGKFNRSGAREDFLYGKYAGSASPRTLKKGEIVAERGALLLTNGEESDIARVASNLHISHDRKTSATLLRFIDDDRNACTLRLNADGTADWQAKDVGIIRTFNSAGAAH